MISYVCLRFVFEKINMKRVKLNSHRTRIHMNQKVLLFKIKSAYFIEISLTVYVNENIRKTIQPFGTSVVKNNDSTSSRIFDKKPESDISQTSRGYKFYFGTFSSEIRIAKQINSNNRTFSIRKFHLTSVPIKCTFPHILPI